MTMVNYETLRWSYMFIPNIEIAQMTIGLNYRLYIVSANGVTTVMGITAFDEFGALESTKSTTMTAMIDKYQTISRDKIIDLINVGARSDMPLLVEKRALAKELAQIVGILPSDN